MVADGYYVERWLFITGFGILFVLYIYQALIEFLSIRRESVGTIKWAAHRIGPISCLLNMIQAIDSSEVFGIWTPENRVDYFLSYNATSCILVLAACSSYSMLMSHSMIIQEKPARWVAFGYVASLALPFICGNTAPAYAVATSSTVPRAWFLFIVAIAFLFCDLSFVVSASSLLRKLDAFSSTSGQQSPQYDTKRMAGAIKSLKRFRLYSIILTNAAIIYQIYAAVGALSKPLQPDPQDFQVGGMGFLFLQWLAVFLILWFTWNRKVVHTGQSGLSNGLKSSSKNNTSPKSGGSKNKAANVSGGSGGSGGSGDEPRGSGPLSFIPDTAAAGLEKSVVSMSDGAPVVLRLPPASIHAHDVNIQHVNIHNAQIGSASLTETHSPSEQSYQRMDDNDPRALNITINENEPSLVEDTPPKHGGHIIIETSVTRN